MINKTEIEEIIENIVSCVYQFMFGEYDKRYKILRNHKKGYHHNGDHKPFIDALEKMSISEIYVLLLIYVLSLHKDILTEVLKPTEGLETIGTQIYEDFGRVLDWQTLLMWVMTKRGPKYTNKNYTYIAYLIENKQGFFLKHIQKQINKETNWDFIIGEDEVELTYMELLLYCIDDIRKKKIKIISNRQVNI